VKGGPDVLPAVRKLLTDKSTPACRRAIEIVAWQGDVASLDKLQAMLQTNVADSELLSWAINKIKSLRPSI